MKKILIFFINFYRKHISPLKKPCCRFRPTCSSYAIIAINKHGAFKGSLMAIARVLRCNPYHVGGYDPVPDKFTLRSSIGKAVEPSACEKCAKKDVCDRESCDILDETDSE